jgi:hypothetical protein
MRSGRLAAGAVLMMALSACSGGTSNGDPRTTEPSPSEGAPSEALLNAEENMASIQDVTYRGTWGATDEAGLFSGRELTTTLRVADSGCEVVRETPDGLRMTTRIVDGTEWFSWSDELLALLPEDRQEQWRERWEFGAAPPSDACDVRHLSDSLDLDTVELVESTTIAGRPAQEYAATAAQPRNDSNGEVQFWLTTDGEPVVVQIGGEYAGLRGPVTLASTNDGLVITRPPRRLWVQH